MFGISSVERQLFSGSCNSCESCYDVGGFNDNAFVAYACGTSVIVLRQANFERLQRIADVACNCSAAPKLDEANNLSDIPITHDAHCPINSNDGSAEISCIVCSTVFGKIAVSCGSVVHIYEPRFEPDNSVSTSERRTVRMPARRTSGLRFEVSASDAANSDVELKYVWYKKSILAVDRDVEVNDVADIDVGRKSSTNVYRDGAPFAAARRVVVLAFSFNGSRLLVGTRDGTLFYFYQVHNPNLRVDAPSDVGEIESDLGVRDSEWRCSWKIDHPNRSHFFLAQFSPDSVYFCTANSAQPSIVSIWYGVQMHSGSVQPGNDSPSGTACTRFQQFTLAHPEPVVCVEWRRFNGLLVPLGAVQNVLLTITADNVCRVWSENQSLYTLSGVGPRDIDGLVECYCAKLASFLSQFARYAATHTRAPRRLIQPMLDTVIRRKVGINNERCLDRICAALRFDLSKMDKQAQPQQTFLRPSKSRAASAPKRKRARSEVPALDDVAVGICHFHLVASVNANTDVALLSAGVTKQGIEESEMSSDNDRRTKANLILNFLNNKETLFSAVIEKFFRALDALVGDDDGEHHRYASGEAEDQSLEEEDSMEDRAELARSVRANMRHAVLNLLDGWHTAADLLVAFSPADGSLLLWTLEHLDPPYPTCFASQLPLVSAPRPPAVANSWSSAGELGSVHLRQAQVSFTNRLPSLMPACDARALAARVRVTNDFSYHTRSALASHTLVAPADLVQCYLIVTQHRNASLNFWQFALSADAPRDRDTVSRDRERAHLQQLPRLPFASYQIHSFAHRLRLTGHADTIRAVHYSGAHQLFVTHSDLALEFWRFYKPAAPGRPRSRARFAAAQLTHIASVKNRLIADTRKRFALLPCALAAAQCFDAVSVPLPSTDDAEPPRSVLLMLSFEERARPAVSATCASMKKLRFYALVLDARWLLDADRAHAQLVAECPMLSEPSGSNPAGVFLLSSALVDADFALDDLVFMQVYRSDQLQFSEPNGPQSHVRQQSGVGGSTAAPASLFDSTFYLVMLTRSGRLTAYAIHVSNRRYVEARALTAGRARKASRPGHDLPDFDVHRDTVPEAEADVSFHVGPAQDENDQTSVSLNSQREHAATSTTTAFEASHQSRLFTVEIELIKLTDVEICDSQRQLVSATLAWNANTGTGNLSDCNTVTSMARQSAVAPYHFAVVDSAATVRCYSLRLDSAGSNLECNELSQSISLDSHCAAAVNNLSISAPFIGCLLVHCNTEMERNARPNQLAFNSGKVGQETDAAAIANLHVFECLSSGGDEWTAVRDETVLSALGRSALLAPAFQDQVLTRDQLLTIAGPQRRSGHRLFAEARFGVCAPQLRSVVAVQRNEIRVFDIDARAAAFTDTIAFGQAALVARSPLPVYHPRVLLNICMVRDYAASHAVIRCLLRALRRELPDTTELRSIVAARFSNAEDWDANEEKSDVSLLTKADFDYMRGELARERLDTLTKEEQQELLGLLNALDIDELIARCSAQSGAPLTSSQTNNGNANATDRTDGRPSANTSAAAASSATYDALFDTPRFTAIDETFELKLDDLELELELDTTDGEEKSQDNVDSQSVALPDGATVLDECGQRFALVLRQSLATGGTAELGTTAFVIWAFHSETQRELLSMIPSVRRGETRWTELRRFGVGWWLKDSALLRTTAEQLVAFELQQPDADALDAAAYQLALGRRALVLNWYKVKRNERMAAFWRQDFEKDAAARRVALKNAYQLLSLQRPAHAIAFFLLVDAFQDALDIAVHKLADFQLAMMLARLLDLNPDIRAKIRARPIAGVHQSALTYLVTHFIIEPFEARMKQSSEADADADGDTLLRFENSAVLASIAYWCVGQYSLGVRALIDGLRAHSTRSAPDRVYQAYTYLKRHPLVQRQSALTVVDRNAAEADERFLHFKLLEQFTHHLGSPLLALLTCAEFERHSNDWFTPSSSSSSTSRRYYEQMKATAFLGYALQDLDTTFLTPYAYDSLVSGGTSLSAPFDAWLTAHHRLSTVVAPRVDRTTAQLDLLAHVLRYCVGRTDADLQPSVSVANVSASTSTDSEVRTPCAQLEMTVRLAISAALSELEARSLLLRRAELSRVSATSRENDALNKLRSVAPRSSIAAVVDASSLSPRVLEAGPKLVKYVVNTGVGASIASSLAEIDYLEHLDALKHELLRAFTSLSLVISTANTPRRRANARTQALHVVKLSEALSRCLFESLQCVSPSNLQQAAKARGSIQLDGQTLVRSAAVKWPGVAALRAMLLLKEQAPRAGSHASHTFGEPQSNFARKFSRILMFLCECFALLYVVRISTAVWLLDARCIHRTLSRELDEACFFAIFGGSVSFQQSAPTPTTTQPSTAPLPPAVHGLQAGGPRGVASSVDLLRAGGTPGPVSGELSPNPGRRSMPPPPPRPPPITKQPHGASGVAGQAVSPIATSPATLTGAKSAAVLANQNAVAPPAPQATDRRESRPAGAPNEFFSPPSYSFNEYFSQKRRVNLRASSANVDDLQYDSDTEAAERFRAATVAHTAELYDDDEERSSNEFTDDKSFSWMLIQFLSFVMARSRMQSFLKKVLQLELEDLNELQAGAAQSQSCCSLYVLFTHLKQFERHAAYQLGATFPEGPPSSYYPIAAVNARLEASGAPVVAGAALNAPPLQLRKHRLLATAEFTPFQPARCGGADPSRLWQAHVLWQVLLKQEPTGALVSKLLCEGRDAQPVVPSSSTTLTSASSGTDLLVLLASGSEHRERDDNNASQHTTASSRFAIVFRSGGEQPINAFSVNEASLTQAVVACGDKDLIELDVGAVVSELSVLRKSTSFSLLRRNSDSHFSLSALWDSFDDGNSVAVRDFEPDDLFGHDSGTEEHEADAYAQKKLDEVDAERNNDKSNGRRYDKKRLRYTRLHIPIARRLHRGHHNHRDRSHKHSQAGRTGPLTAATVAKKQTTSIVRCITAHPQLPFYVTGTQDGNIQVQRFSASERLAQLRPPNSLFPKVTKLEFTREGNRVGASDAEGAVSFWHLNVIGASATNSQPYYSLKCHSKATHDFTFLNSATVFASAGLANTTAATGAAILASSACSTTWSVPSTGNASTVNGGSGLVPNNSYAQLTSTISTTNTDAHSYNVCIWDTLLHPRKALAYGVRLFDDESQSGAAASPNANTLLSDCHVLQHCPMHSLLFVGTRRGMLHCIDMRMFSECRNTVRSWYAHDAGSSIKALAIDPQERCLVTGSASGEIKLWSISSMNGGGALKPLAAIRRQPGTPAAGESYSIDVGEAATYSASSSTAAAHHSGSAGVKNAITQLRVPVFEPNLLFASSATGALSVFSLNKILESSEF